MGRRVNESQSITMRNNYGVDRQLEEEKKITYALIHRQKRHACMKVGLFFLFQVKNDARIILLYFIRSSLFSQEESIHPYSIHISSDSD